MSNEKKYILAIDQSTSATKVMLFNRQAEFMHRVGLPHKKYYPQPGFVESKGGFGFDPDSIATVVIEKLNSKEE